MFVDLSADYITPSSILAALKQLFSCQSILFTYYIKLIAKGMETALIKSLGKQKVQQLKKIKNLTCLYIVMRQDTCCYCRFGL